MPISEVCNREVVIVHRDNTAFEAAQLMRQHHVGDVVIVEERQGARIPVGIVTDRDLVVEIMALGVDQNAITMSDIMMTEIATIKEGMGVSETIEYMRGKGVRRMPVVDLKGGLVGIITLDDLLELLAEEFLSLSRVVKHGQEKEYVTRH